VVYKKPRIKTKTARGVSIVRNDTPPPVKIVAQLTTKGSICSEMFRSAAHQKLKYRLKGVSISRNGSLIFNKKRLIFIPNPGGQLRPKYPPMWFGD
jgi:hypothetical protein